MSEPISYDALVVHYGELALKGENRGRFERRLGSNVENALRSLLPGVRARPADGRLLVRLPEGADVAAAIARVAPLPGIAWLAPVVAVEPTVEAAEAAVRRLARRAPGTGPFKIDTKRAWKGFPETSVELNRRLGTAVIEETGRPVDLTDPETTFGVRVTRQNVLLHCDRIAGVGGLPSGVMGRLLSFLSGGIDSPVATWTMMRRGVTCIPVHFHNRSAGGDRVIAKIEALCEILARTQGRVEAIFVPFEGLQREIVANVPDAWRMIVYRRTMLRIGESLLATERALGFVTGDCVGQVASQTLENFAVIRAATHHAVYSPLCGHDKTEIVALARRIGTYETSILPHDDCCSFLVAAHPKTRARLAEVEALEAACDLDPLVEEALDRAWRRKLVAP